MDSATIEVRVDTSYRRDDLNCATTTLNILAEHCGIELADQLKDAAIGMHGAGGYRAQCGLVEGTLMFIGVLGRAKGIDDKEIVDFCYRYGQRFEQHFSSLLCRELRPEGFSPDLPPHLCEGLTCKSVAFSIKFVDEMLAGGVSDGE